MKQCEIKYSADHIWIRLDDGDLATVGISEDAFKDGEDITRVQLASESGELIKDETFGRFITSRPAVYRLYMPVSCNLIEINDEIVDAPEMILEDPYEEGWLLRVSIINFSEFDDLMSQSAYTAFVDGDFLDDEELEDDDLDVDDDWEPYGDDDF